MKEIVIEIRDEVYERLLKPNESMDYTTAMNVRYAIKNGKVLLKGHGRLIDADNIVYDRECVWESDGCCTTKSIPNIAETPTLVEADKGEDVI